MLILVVDEVARNLKLMEPLNGRLPGYAFALHSIPTCMAR